MTKYYDIYFDPEELIVDDGGELTNPEVLRTVEFDEEGNVCSITNNSADTQDVLSMFHLGCGDDTLEEAEDRFYKWLWDNTEWREVSPQTYWQPAEYICVGVTGYVDDPPRKKFRYLVW